MKRARLKTLILRGLVLIFSVVLFFVLPIFGLGENEDLQRIYGVFVGKKSEYQGIIEVWNVDTFESGTTSKASFMTNVSKDFQKTYKGVYILVRNLTEYECLNLLSRGEMPDLFSCSYGVAAKISEYVQAFSSAEGVDIRAEFIDAGTTEDGLMAIAWCRGVYTLITTNEKLTSAGVEITEGMSLTDIALTSGYVTQTKKGEKITYSLCFGRNKYLLPQLSLSSYNDNGAYSNSSTAINASETNQTSYSAYTKFLAGNSTLLLGTGRDVLRIENRVANGKLTDVLYEPLTDFTDMVQFCLLAKNSDSTKLKCAELFAKFLASRTVQSKLASFGMFPVIMADANLYGEGVMRDIALEINGDLRLFDIFISEEEIENLR